MKIKHKLNPGWRPKAEPISPAYQAEIDATMRRAERAWHAAVRAAERAEVRSERHLADVDLRFAAADARIAADARWQELKAHEAQMRGRRGSKHSGRGTVHRIGNKGTI